LLRKTHTTNSKQEYKKYKGKSNAATKKKDKKRRKSPLSLSKKLHGISLILDTKYYRLSSSSFFKKTTTVMKKEIICTSKDQMF